MRAVTWLAVAIVVGGACSEIKVPPPPGGLDAIQDRGALEVADPGGEVAGDPGGEAALDVPPCHRDEDCAFLLPRDDSGCRVARCDPVKGCVLDNVLEGHPCDPSGQVPVPPVCKKNQCDGQGACVQVPVDDGTLCDPGTPPEPCTAYACHAGECLPSQGCDDDNPCTEDSCVSGTGTCQHTPLTGGTCEDDDPCTVQESCFAGMCVGKPDPCDDQNSCTDDRCAKETGCVHLPLDGAACDDGDSCTRDDACQGGKCKPGAYLVCDDGNRCTTDRCDPKTGACEFTPTTSVCDDGDPCTDPDQCQNGQCLGMPKDCDDQDPCTADSCQPGTGCVHPVIPGCKPCSSDPDCNDGNPCTVDTCTAGECLYDPLTGTECNDGNPCTIEDQCQEGACVSGPAKDCDDGNVCTDDSCDPSTGECARGFNTLACDDGNLCTQKDQCFQGSCVGTPVSCDDGNLCTDDSCNPTTGKCVNAYNSKPCDDGKFCTANDQCSQGACAGSVVTCNDNNPCTKDSCDETNDKCVNDPIAGCLNCALDKDCNDGNACTQDKCVNSKCEFTPLNGTPCEDGNKCTANDSCKSGACQAGTPVVCTPRVCNTVACDPAQGCVYTPQTGGTCDDGNACTGPDQCVAGACVSGPLLCCEGRPDGTPCSDQNDSTGPDYCIAGQCRGFLLVPFSAGDQTGLTAVDAAASPVAVGWYQNAGDKFKTGFVADLPFGKKPMPISATKVSGSLYRSVSSWLAVGDGGLVAYRTSWSTGWTVGGILAEVLASMDPRPGNLADVFGTRGPDPGGFCLCCRADSYLMVGRDADGAQAWARQCTVYQSFPIAGGCTTKAKCGQFALEGLDPAAAWPVAVAGLPAPECPGTCLDEAAIASRVESPLGIFQAAASHGKTGGTFIETFRLLGLLSVPGYRVRDMVRVTDPDAGPVYLAVGDAGTFLVVNADNRTVSQVKVLGDQDTYDFTGVAVGQEAGYLFLSATQRNLPEDARALVLIVHPLAMSLQNPDSYFPMTLGTCNPKNNGCVGYSLDDVTAAGVEVTLVGNSLVNKAPTGLVYYLKL